jgi:hypothetical protein
VIRINSAACFLKPSRHPGRTVMCALNSKGAIGPPVTVGRTGLAMPCVMFGKWDRAAFP